MFDNNDINGDRLELKQSTDHSKIFTIPKNVYNIFFYCLTFGLRLADKFMNNYIFFNKSFLLINCCFLNIQLSNVGYRMCLNAKHYFVKEVCFHKMLGKANHCMKVQSGKCDTSVLVQIDTTNESL